MRVVIQRVSQASVSVVGQTIGSIGAGYMLLVGITHTDTQLIAEKLAEKIIKIRLFPDTEKPINASIMDYAGEILVVSQFTLYADTRKGNRPSFIDSAQPDHAKEIYDFFCHKLSELLGKPVQTGRFGAMMDVALNNHGPVTIVLDSQSDT